jgi:hypothetical protein
MLGWNDIAHFGTTVSKWMEFYTWTNMNSDDFDTLRQREKFTTPQGTKRIVATEKHVGILKSLGAFPDIETEKSLETRGRIIRCCYI